MFFVISVFFELLCCFLYAFVFPKLPIVKYYRKKAASEGSTTVASDLAAGGVSAQGLDEVRGLFNSLLMMKFRNLTWNRISIVLFIMILQTDKSPKQLERLSNYKLLLQNADYALAIFLIYVLTLSIFPGFLSEDTGSHGLGSWWVLCKLNHWTHAIWLVMILNADHISGMSLSWLLCTTCGISSGDMYPSWNALNWNPGRVFW